MVHELRKAWPPSLSPLKSEGNTGLTWEVTKGVGCGEFRSHALGIGLSSESKNSVSLHVGSLFSFDIIAHRALLISGLATWFTTNACSNC